MKAAALEQTLRDQPDDPASWRVYGDWLTEQGDARGALIGLEQRHARARPTDREALEHEIAALVKEHRQSWDAALPPGATVLARRYGFATKVAVEWSDSAPVLIEQALRAPFVTALRIAPAANDDEAYWDGDPDGAEEPTPSPSIDTGVLATLNLGRLVELDLSYLRIGAIGAEALAVSTYFRFEASDAKDFGASTAMGRTEALDLRYSRVGDAGLAALAASPGFSGVRRLHLQRNLLAAEGMRALRRFENLTELDLRYNEIGAEGVEALLEAPFIGSLRRLLLNRADVGDAGAKMLACAPRLPPALRSYWRNV
ncbi:TIGR02996 domain-containing protein [Actinomadura alba]|uniref:TIGR02996 domain-containing protein n=1 Tax=Actinomadura alba TaxID=406431 RepID=A0ABR7LP73_9ACTN|nr:TIGR02996 domain-containing protein [Actinomadura alba]MBC6466473.1 TIGR02996 domain-containing protein [Actinomadura alba]